MVYLFADSHLSKYWPFDSDPTGSRTHNLLTVSPVHRHATGGLVEQKCVIIVVRLPKAWNWNGCHVFRRYTCWSGACCCLVASLLSCLYQLKAENRTLEERIATMTARRDRLLAVNARLSVPLASPGGNSHGADTDSQQPTDNGLADDSSTARRSKSPRSTTTAAPAQQQNYTALRVIMFSSVRLFLFVLLNICPPKRYSASYLSRV